MTDQPITRADLAQWLKEGRHSKIVEAKNAGLLNHLYGDNAPHTVGDQLTREDVQRLAAEGRHAEIDAAYRAGRITTNPTR